MRFPAITAGQIIMAEEQLNNEGEQTPPQTASGEAAGNPAAGDEAAAGEAPRNPNLKCYIVHTYSGFERKVRESLESRVQAFHLQDKFGKIIIPTEPVTEIRNGKKYTTERAFLPGYVLVEMEMDLGTPEGQNLWHVVKSTPRVTGFLGPGNQPTPM